MDLEKENKQLRAAADASYKALASCVKRTEDQMTLVKQCGNMLRLQVRMRSRASGHAWGPQ